MQFSLRLIGFTLGNLLRVASNLTDLFFDLALVGIKGAFDSVLAAIHDEHPPDQ